MDEGFFEVQYKPGQELVIRVRPLRLGTVKNEAFNHFLAANREGLLAVRSILDAAIKATDRPEKTDKGGKKRIQVE